MDGLDDGADAAGWTSGSPEQSPGLQLVEGALTEGPESGVVAVELLAVLGLFAVVVVPGAEGCAGALAGAVGPPSPPAPGHRRPAQRPHVADITDNEPPPCAAPTR